MKYIEPGTTVYAIEETANKVRVVEAVVDYVHIDIEGVSYGLKVGATYSNNRVRWVYRTLEEATKKQQERIAELIDEYQKSLTEDAEET